ncbi:MAG: M28 family peptidase [Planctomycetes bacterium]|nr:M28 family peptidase [Planctomycetota bacterium]
MDRRSEPADIAAMRRDVEALTAPGERVVGGPGLALARRWLVDRLAMLGLEPYHGWFEWPYEHAGIRFCNLLARIPGQQSALDPLLLAAHYDTCGAQPGADDNAAAVAILLACVDALRAAALRRDVILAMFDAEEPPYFLSEQMGSVHFYHQQRREPTHCAIVLDLCGHDVPVPGLEDLLFVTGMESAPGLDRTIVEGETLPGLRTVAVSNEHIGDLSDHHAFRRAGRPFLFLTCGRWEHYHAPTDTPERLSYGKMLRIRDWVVRAAVDIADRTLAPEEGYDPTPTELRSLRQNLGPVLEALGIEVRTRADIGRVVAGAIQLFGV